MSCDDDGPNWYGKTGCMSGVITADAVGMGVSYGLDANEGNAGALARMNGHGLVVTIAGCVAIALP